MIGHMILSRSREPMSGHVGSSAILGLKVEGDRLLESGVRGALIEKVKKGSIADVEGQLRPGQPISNVFRAGFGSGPVRGLRDGLTEFIVVER